MKSSRCPVLLLLLLLCFSLLTACFARLPQLGINGTPTQPQTLVPAFTPTKPGAVASASTEPVTVVSTATPDLTARQVITASIIDDMPNVLGVVVDENNQVVEVEHYSAAEAAGIQRGDILDSVDEIAFKAKQEAKNKIKEAKNNQKVKVKLKRNGKAIALDLVPSVPHWPENAPTGTPIPTPQDYF